MEGQITPYVCILLIDLLMCSLGNFSVTVIIKGLLGPIFRVSKNEEEVVNIG